MRGRADRRQAVSGVLTFRGHDREEEPLRKQASAKQ